MAKFRTRVKGSKKTKLWTKGHSSDSNPATHKFRERAKSKFFQPLPGPSNESKLTQKAVEMFNYDSGGGGGRAMEDDEVSFGGTTTTCKTFNTFASDWSACSNQSFSRLITRFSADSALQKDMLAVLAAVTEVIKQNDGSESSTEYFAALLTALMADDYNDDQVTAIVNLLAMGIKSVPRAVLQSRFAESTSLLTNLLTKYANTDRVSLVRSILGCLSVLLRAQDAQAWNDSSTIQVLRAVLAFVSFSKPKVRKAAQHSVVAIVRQSDAPHAGLAEIATHCTQLVETVSATGGITTTLHVLALLKDVIHSFPRKQLKSCCETILKIMTLNNVLVTSCSMQALNGLFTSATPEQLPSELAAKLINALYDYQPPPTDSQPIHAWMTLMQQGHVNLGRSYPMLCSNNLPRLYRTLTEFYLSDRPDTSAAVTGCLQVVSAECLPECPESSQLYEVIDIHHALLSYQYFKSLNLVLHLITALFKSVGRRCREQLMPIFKTLAEFRESNQTLFPNEIDNAIGAAISSLGPEPVIRALPLLVNDPSQEFKRSWLLPLFKEHVKGSTLKCYIDTFFPLTTLCRQETERHKAANDQVRALSYDLLQSQIWALLPSFANQPTDITATFPNIAKALGGVLGARSDLRLIVLSTLRLLVSFALDEGREEDQSTLGRFAKNFLPILFNIYTTKVSRSDEEGVRLAALETIKVYLRLTPPELSRDLFQRALDKAQSADSDQFLKECSLDLLGALTRHQPFDTINNLYDLVSANISKTAMQKKYYKLLEGILTAKSDATKQFLESRSSEVIEMVVTSFDTANPSSKGARLRCIVELLDIDSTRLTEATLPEAVLCLKDINSRTRATAHKILATLYERKPVEQLINPLLLGLTSEATSLVSCSVLALASLVYHCRDNLPAEVESQILHNVGLLALSPTRDIVSAAMAFIKVYVTSQPKAKVELSVPRLMKIFSAMHEDVKSHNRNRTRDIIARLIRWFGGETVLPLVPPGDEVLLLRTRNLAKIHGRKQRKRASERASEATVRTTFSAANRHKTIDEILAESDEDMDAEPEEPKRKTQKNKTWITEGNDEIVDFTDSRMAARNVTSTKPVPRVVADGPAKGKLPAFKSAPDGRLIITGHDEDDDSDDGGIVKKKKRKSVLPGVDVPQEDSDDYSDEEDDWMTTTGGETIARKRTRSVSTATSGPSSKYHAGGKGIHRPVGGRKAGGSGNNPYRQSGAEYRSKKATGDVRRSGKPDPFAYLPLRRDALNKRKRMKAIGSLKSVLNAARKGAAAGSKKKMMRNATKTRK